MYNVKPSDIPVELIEDWLNDSVADSWPDFIARRLNQAIELGLVVSKQRFDNAVNQNYCVTCGDMLQKNASNNC